MSRCHDWLYGKHLNTLRSRQNGRYFADDTFKRIFLNEDVRILITISRKFVPKGLIVNIPALVQIMAWRRPGDKPLYELMIVRLSTHICVTRPQWVNFSGCSESRCHAWNCLKSSMKNRPTFFKVHCHFQKRVCRMTNALLFDLE